MADSAHPSVVAQEPEHEELLRRYNHDPVFHAVVHLLGRGGWADDQGLSHQGPSIGDASRAWKFMASLEANGLCIAAHSDDREPRG